MLNMLYGCGLRDNACVVAVLHRYETMYEPCCANALFEHICSCTNRPLTEAHSMAAEFVGSKVPRKSRVMPEQLRTMYVDLQQQIDDLPRVFIRDKAGIIHALVAAPAISIAIFPT